MSSAAGKRCPPARLFLIAVLVSLGSSFHFGAQLTLTNPCQSAFLEFLNGSVQAHFHTILPKPQLEALWSCTVAVLFIGAMLGALCLRRCAERLGRKYGLMLAFSLSLTSFGIAILSYFINSFETYAISRVIMGFSVSLSVGIAGMFLTECSPKECRGSVSMTLGIMMQCGTVAGSVLGMPQVLGLPDTWWMIYTIEAVPMLLVLVVFLPFIHETPSYLMSQGREAAARHAIRFYHALEHTDAAEAVLQQMRRDNVHHKKSACMLEVWRHQGYTRRSTIVGCVISVALVFSGTAVIAAYAVSIFLNSGMSLMEASIANVGLSTVTVISCIISTFIVDRFGRRRLLLSMYTAMLFTNLGIFTLLFLYDHYHYEWAAIGLIAMFCAFLFCFAMGPGPLAFFITSEMMSQNTRSAGQSWMYVVQMICRTISLAVFLPLQNCLGAAWSYLLLFVAPVLFAIVFFYFQLPETKNRDLAGIQREFERLPTLKSTLNVSRRSLSVGITSRLPSMFRSEDATNPIDLENAGDCENRQRPDWFSEITTSITDLLSSRNFTTSSKQSVAESPVQNSDVEAADTTSSVEASLSSSFADTTDERSSTTSSSEASPLSSASSSTEYIYGALAVTISETSPPRLKSESSKTNFSFSSSPSSSKSPLQRDEAGGSYYRSSNHGHLHGYPPPTAERFRHFPSLSQMRTNTICIDIPEERESQLGTTRSLVSTRSGIDNFLPETNTAFLRSETSIHDQSAIQCQNTLGEDVQVRQRKENWFASLWHILSNIGSSPYSPRRY